MRKQSVNDWKEKTGTVCLGDWAKEYLDFAQAKFFEKTYKEKKSMFKRLFQKIQPELPVSKLSFKMVMNFIIEQSKKRSGYSANKDRKNLIAGWNWGMKYMTPSLPGPNPCLVEKMPEVRHPRYIPPEKDFWKVYDAAEGQDKVMLLAYLYLGARRGEIFRLMWVDVDFGNCMVRLGTHKRKGGNLEYSWLPMVDDLYDALLNHRQESNSEWVFLNAKTEKPFRERKRWMPGLCKRAKAKRFGLHAIRHLTASILAQNGVPAIQIQAILRHKKLSTTELYLHQREDLKQALTLLTKNKKPSGEPSRGNVVEIKNRVAM